VLMRELSALYQAYAAGREPALPEPEVQYADYAAWQRTWLSGEVLERQLPGARGWAAARAFELGDDLALALRSLARQEGCTLHMALLAGFQALLSHAAGQDDVSVGTPIAGRMQREVEGLVGFFTNTLVIRTDLSGAPSF